MSRFHWLLVLMLAALISACGPAPQTAQSPNQSSPSPPAATATSVPAQTAVSPTLVATTQPTRIPPATEPPASQTPDSPPAPPATEPPASTATPTPATPALVAQGQEVLTIAAGSGPDQVGITETEAPPTFRVAADGSIRVMDMVNKRLLFFNAPTAGQPYKLAQTIDLAFLERPTDFVVTGNGDLYVLDAEAWQIAHLSIDGKQLNTIPLNPETKGKFTTISLTADGRIIGLAENRGYILLTPGGPIALEDQPNAQIEGVATVRSNAIFSIVGDNSDQYRQSLLINYGGIAPATIPMGHIEARVAFLDINQGMEPYTIIQRGNTAEIQRFNVEGQLLGTLTLDRSGCRAVARGVYVDRPGDVYTMCVSDQGLSITRYTMVDAQGQPLPRHDQLVESAFWSPGNLQSAPG